MDCVSKKMPMNDIKDKVTHRRRCQLPMSKVQLTDRRPVKVPPRPPDPRHETPVPKQAVTKVHSGHVPHPVNMNEM